MTVLALCPLGGSRDLGVCSDVVISQTPADTGETLFASCFWCLPNTHRGLSAEPSDAARRDEADADLDDSEVAYIARSKRDVAEHFGVAWSTMQPRLVGKIGAKVRKKHLISFAVPPST